MSGAKERAKIEPASHRASVVGAQLFAEKGYSATTTREISRALGVTNGTFYHHFETKEDLLVQICDESMGRIAEATEIAVNGVAAGAPPLARLSALIRSHTVTMLGDQPLHMTGLTELRALSPSNRERITERRDEYAAFVREQIESCQAAGALRRDLSAGILTLLLLNMLNWTVFWFDIEGERTPDELADAIVALFLEGAAA
jgi:TetR/AcrR family transcriptional regulator, cholesterol catabolism regulator